MRIWIDATQPASRVEIFSMALLERQLRAIADSARKVKTLEVAVQQAGIYAARRPIVGLYKSRLRPTEIWIELLPGEPDPTWIPEEFTSELPIRWMREPGSTQERLDRALNDAAGETVLAFSADAVIDQRLLEHMAWSAGGSSAFISENGDESTAVMRLHESLPELPSDTNELLEIARNAVKAGAVKQLDPEDVDTYIKKLRRDLAAYAFRIADEASRARAQRFLFDSNYKGSTDFMTKWVYPPLVWRMLIPLTRRRVRPNTVTFIGMTACFAAVPFFAAGSWVTGLGLAYVMSILDSVDGKLARVTFQSSEQGDVLDHGVDIIHPPFWYWAWGWALSGGDVSSPIFHVSMWICVFYIFDRVMEMLFTASTGRSIHGYTEFDARIRTFISRRNVNLALFTVALPLGLAVQAFYLIVGWQAASALFHLSRVIRFWNVSNSRVVGSA
jgi:phosphatidylglycerophosphate synthase